MERTAAQQALDAARRPGALAKRMRASWSFPGPLQKLLLAAAETRGGYWAQQVIDDAEGGLAQHFASLSAAKLQKVQKTLLPALQPAVAAAWQALAHRPYQRGAARRPFRCPHDVGTLAERRGGWLLTVANLLGDYDGGAAWVAEWAPHLAQFSGASELGWLLAGALDHGGREADEVFAILQASIAGGHAVAAMGRHVTQALMSCGRQDAWELNEKLLLAAQRQEGLRQVVLEAVDEAHPQAFRRMLRLILDADLARFAAVVRAVDVWFGFQWGTGSERKVSDVLATVLTFFDEPEARAAALRETDAERAYLALWTLAFDDVGQAIPPALAMLADARADKRFVAAHLLVQTEWMPTRKGLLAALDDQDLRVAARALDAYRTEVAPWVEPPEVFPALERLMARLGDKPRKLEPLVWPWWAVELGRAHVAEAMVDNQAGIAQERVVPHAAALPAPQREAFVRILAGLDPRWQKPNKRKAVALGETAREFLIEMLGDAAASVRQAAFEGLAARPLLPDETARLVDLLARKAGDLRTRCLSRLRALTDADLLATVDRLLGDGDLQRRLAGLELLRDAIEHRRVEAPARERARAFAGAVAPTAAMQAHLDAILGADERLLGFDGAFGLVDAASLPTWPAPRPLRAVDGAGARRCLESLATLLHAHREAEVSLGEGEPVLLFDAGHGLPTPLRPAQALEVEARLPLRDVFAAWAATVEPQDILDAYLSPTETAAWQGPKMCTLGKGGPRVAWLARGVLSWALYWRAPAGAGGRAVHAVECRLASITAADVRELLQDKARIHCYGDQVKPWQQRFSDLREVLALARRARELLPDAFLPADRVALYGLLRAATLRLQGADELIPSLREFLDAVAAGGLGAHAAAEFTDLLIGRFADRAHCQLLEAASARVPAPELAAHPELLAVVDRCRRRIVEVECKRGDRHSPASVAALHLRWPGGLDALALALPALGATKFARHDVYAWSQEISRPDALSVLVARSAPRPEDTPEAFAAWAKAAQLQPTRLIELAVYAPQWALHVAAVLQWPGFLSAVWWIQAHTKDDSWNQRDLREEWAARISEYTPLAAQDLTEGAVDVAWFRAAHAELGAERWAALHAAAKYASSSGGHRRAQRFADAMTGAVTRAAILAEIDGKRQQDAVRALGLLPLAGGDGRQDDLLLRYRRLQAFRRESRKFGSQRQASEGRAAALGLENLARTAGFRDPLRLQWAMEAAAVADLAAGPVVVEKGETVVQLRIDGDGSPQLAVTRRGRTLAAVPAALRKDADVVALRERNTELRRQAARVRQALEEAMCRGDAFAGAELQELFANPMLSPSLERLVFVGDGIAGYPTAAGKALRRFDGTLEPVRAHEQLRIAHPHDLFVGGDWPQWQRECLRSERLQPFKQVFRELYPITADERADGKRARRYAGHQVQPRQALALLGGRGWVSRPDEGVSRTFHAEGVVAWLGFARGSYTPAEVDGLTLEAVMFTRRGEHELLPLAAVAPRLYSEIMRDLDLVVSVAHRGGVDPEATASTVEMRASLLRETCSLLSLDNVTVQDRHAVVRGSLGEYSLHLGSAQVRLLGGPALCIVAVPSQHRGRLFLPFADDDPRTAEVMSKALLLARDSEIQDPQILDQLRGPRG